MTKHVSLSTLKHWASEARARSLELISDLSCAQLSPPYLPTINPLLWEVCHLVYFQELWVLRTAAGQTPYFDNADQLFDSGTIGHEARWRLPMPERAEALKYIEDVLGRVLALCDSGELDERGRYFLEYSIYHEDMHAEALTYSRQTLGYPAPEFDVPKIARPPTQTALGDVHFAGGTFLLGAAPDGGFCFDNEKWQHPVSVAPFAMARTAVSEGAYAAFVADDGYLRRELWSAEGWAYLQGISAILPAFWRKTALGYERRQFDRWAPIVEDRAMVHVSYYEAQAYCFWARRRLPTEAEWEWAAAGSATAVENKQRYPWGEEAPAPNLCHMDWQTAPMGPANVHAYPAGDSEAGCRQMLGNVWEWTSTVFRPYPEFHADMYSDYSQTSFATRNVLRGGSWASRSRMLRNTWRNYFQLGRRDIFAGFRTCAL